MEQFITIAVVFYVLLVMYAANQVDAGIWEIDIVRMALYGLSLFVFLIAPCSLNAVFLSMQPAAAELLPPVDPLQAIGVAVFAGGAAIFSYNLIRAPEMRLWLTRYVRGYKPDSTVHLTAALLCLMVVTTTVFQFVIGGGLTGVAESIQNDGVSPFASLFETSLWIIASFLGVGFAIRRTLLETLNRLGLRLPTSRDVWIGIGVGVLLYIAVYVYAVIWQSLADPQSFEEQNVAAQEMANQIGSLPVALLVGAGAAFGEETFMRGALQPVFGLWLTSAFFASLHTQYLLTPTTLFIFGLGLALGLVRQRVSTTAAIIAHLVYNVLPFLLLSVLGGAS